MYRDFKDIKPVCPILLSTKVVVGDKIYLFSGAQKTCVGRPDMVMVLSVQEDGEPRWDFELATGLRRPQINTLGMCGCFDGKDTVYLFGGYSIAPTLSKFRKDLRPTEGWKSKNHNTLYTYSIKNNSFKEIEINQENSIPSGRYGASLVYSKDTFALYLFGGSSGDGLHIDEIVFDLWKFDLLSLSWEVMSCTRTPSPSLTYHSANMTNDGKRMIIYGGLTYAGAGANSPNMKGMRPTGKYGSLGFFREGKSPKIVVSNQLWILHLETLTWKRIRTISKVKPTRRFLHDSQIVGSKIIFGFGASGYEQKLAIDRVKSKMKESEPEEAEEGRAREKESLGGRRNKKVKEEEEEEEEEEDWEKEMKRIFNKPKRSIYMFDLEDNKWHKILKIRKKPRKKKKKNKDEIHIQTEELSRVLLVPSGAGAIGVALKIARLVTGRYKTISMWDSFHGASLDTISIGGESLFRQTAGPLLPGCIHVPPPDDQHCIFGCNKDGDGCNLSCADYIEYILEREEISAVISEPMRWMPYIPRKEYWGQIRDACDRHGALLIFDEIPNSLGRTGEGMFTYEYFDVVPDILVLGKGLGGGILPSAAIITKEEYNEVSKEVALGHYTHEKNPLVCVAGLATLEYIEENELIQKSKMMGERVLNELKTWKDQFVEISDVRGVGLLIGIELINAKNKERNPELAESIMYDAIMNGLSFKLTMGSIITLCPPLIISDEEMDEALRILKFCFEKNCSN